MMELVYVAGFVELSDEILILLWANSLIYYEKLDGTLGHAVSFSHKQYYM